MVPDKISRTEANSTQTNCVDGRYKVGEMYWNVPTLSFAEMAAQLHLIVDKRAEIESEARQDAAIKRIEDLGEALRKAKKAVAHDENLLATRASSFEVAKSSIIELDDELRAQIFSKKILEQENKTLLALVE